jgi:serine/threonine-protein kinase PknK
MRAVIVEDQGLLLDAVSMGLGLLGVDVVGEARDEGTAIRIIAETAPDIALIDVRLPNKDEGIRVAEIVRANQPQVGLLVFSANAEATYLDRLLSIKDAEPRAIGYWDKNCVRDMSGLVETMHRIATGELSLDPQIVERKYKNRTPRAAELLKRLTPRELQILKFMAEGRSNAGIAKGLSQKKLSPEELSQKVTAVERAISTIATKLGLPTKADPERNGINIRVLAVLMFLRGNDEEGPTGVMARR